MIKRSFALSVLAALAALSMACGAKELPTVRVSVTESEVRGDEKALFSWDSSELGASYELSILQITQGKPAERLKTIKTKATSWAGCLPEGSYSATVTAYKGKAISNPSNSAFVESVSTSRPTWDDIDSYFLLTPSQIARLIGQSGSMELLEGGKRAFSFEDPDIILYYDNENTEGCDRAEIQDRSFLVFGMPFEGLTAEKLAKALDSAGVKHEDLSYSGRKATASQIEYEYDKYLIECSFDPIDSNKGKTGLITRLNISELIKPTLTVR